MYGEYQTSVVIGSGGPGQGPIDSNSGDVYVQYQGGVQISPKIVTNSIDSQTQTFTSDQTRLPNDIQWSANFNVGYTACFVTYEGVDYTGGPVAPAGGESAGTSEFACAVDFACEGGISADWRIRMGIDHIITVFYCQKVSAFGMGR